MLEQERSGIDMVENKLTSKADRKDRAIFEIASEGESAENLQARQERIKELKSQVKEADDDGPRPRSSKERIDEYIEKNVPAVYRNPTVLTRAFGTVSEAFTKFFQFARGVKLEGKDKVPEDGPCLVIANHTRNGDPATVRAMVGRDTYFLAADMHFPNAIQSFFMRKLGFIEVESTLSHLEEEELAGVMERAPKGAKWYYELVKARDEKRKTDPEERKKNTEKQRKVLQEVVGMLAQGKAVSIFPEGLWTYEGPQLRQAQRGARVIALEYKRLTGKDLPILPIAISDKAVRAGEVMTFSDGRDVDDVMREIANLLPEEERGYYADA